MKSARKLTLGSLISISKGKKHSIADRPSVTSKRLLGIDDLRNDTLLRFTDDKSGTDVMPSDVLIAWDGANAGTIGYGKSGFIGSTIARLRFKESNQLYTPFLGLFLQSKFDYLRQTATGATIPHINRKVLENIVLPGIELDDQIRIAHLLNKVEGLIAQRKQHLQQLDDLLKSVFLEMFGDPVRNEKGWDTGSLSSYGSFKNGLNFGKGESGVTVRYLGVGDFKSKAKLTDIDALASIELHQLPAADYFLKDGDLLFVRSNGNRELVGRCMEVYPGAKVITYSGFCIRYRINKPGLHPTYIAHLFRSSAFRRTLFQGGQGANIQNINQQALSGLPIPFPSLDLQNHFAAIVEKVEGLKSRYQHSLTELENLYGALSQQAFKGELDLSRVPLDSKLENDETDKNHENRIRVAV
jgi:type I restriction enzyme, S subunit